MHRAEIPHRGATHVQMTLSTLLSGVFTSTKKAELSELEPKPCYMYTLAHDGYRLEWGLASSDSSGQSEQSGQRGCLYLHVGAGDNYVKIAYRFEPEPARGMWSCESHGLLGQKLDFAPGVTMLTTEDAIVALKKLVQHVYPGRI